MSWESFYWVIGFAHVIPKFDVGGGLLTWKALQENVDFYLFRHATLRAVPPYIKVTNVGASVPSIYPLLIGGLIHSILRM